MHPSMVSSVATTKLTSYRKACATTYQLNFDYRVQNDGAEVDTRLKKISDILERDPRGNKEVGNSLLLQGF